MIFRTIIVLKCIIPYHIICFLLDSKIGWGVQDKYFSNFSCLPYLSLGLYASLGKGVGRKWLIAAINMVKRLKSSMLEILTPQGITGTSLVFRDQ